MRTKVLDLRLQQLHRFVGLCRRRSVAADRCPPTGAARAYAKVRFAGGKRRDSCRRVCRGALSPGDGIVGAPAVVGIPKALDPL